ncbi:MAG TPA: VWA domain-containing protein [Blastocatellia bacterium]|nr:VWA domain-containing protein [Blastocatellia bacterium]
MKRSILVASLGVFLALSAAPARPLQGGQQGAQQEEPVQLGTELVNVPFNVTDKKNKQIVDVNREEVQVLEDGKPQEIFSFERKLETPLTIALLVDISGSQEYSIGAEREAAARFLQKVVRPDKDLACVVTFAKEVTLEQLLTGNLESLNKALDRVRVSVSSGFGRGGTAPTNPLAGGTSMFDAVYLAADDILRPEAGRRVIILVTDGEDTTSSYNSAAAIERAWRSEVIIYCIGIGDPRLQSVNGSALDKLSKETGGRSFEPRSFEDLDKAFAEIENDLRQQYIVSYTPSNTARDGTFRKIEIRLAGEARKDLKVRFRRGYYAPRA